MKSFSSNRIAVITAALGLMIAVACEDVDVGVDPDIASPVTVEIGFGQTVTIDDFAIEMKLHSVQDGRCPSNAYCDWPGMALLRFEIIALSDTVFLDLPMLGASVTADSADYMPIDTMGVRLTLTGLLPYPPVAHDSEYVATVVVSTQQEPDSVDSKAELTNQTPQQILIDTYMLDTIDIRGNLLDVELTYSGGCADHFFWALMTPDSFSVDKPRYADIYLRHFTFGDPCDAIIFASRTFDLTPLIEQYVEQFDREEPFVVKVHTDSSDSGTMSLVWYPEGWQRQPILPAWTGTYWVYLDSNWTSGSLEVSTDTVEVTGSFSDSMGSWWTLSRPFPTSTDTIMIRGDTIFDRQIGFSGDIPLLNMIYPPAEDTAVTYSYLIAGCIASIRTVSRVDSLIDTPFGSVAGAYQYGTWGINCSERQYVVPGIGFVYYDWECWQPISHGPVRKVVLTEIYLTR